MVGEWRVVWRWCGRKRRTQMASEWEEEQEQTEKKKKKEGKERKLEDLDQSDCMLERPS